MEHIVSEGYYPKNTELYLLRNENYPIRQSKNPTGKEVTAVFHYALFQIQALLANTRINVFYSISIKGIPHFENGRINNGHFPRISMIWNDAI